MSNVIKNLPEAIQFVSEETGEIMSRQTSDVINTLIKSAKVQDLKDEEGNVKMSAKDVVKNILLQNFKSKEGEYELPEEMADYSKLNDQAASIVAGHREAVAKADAEKNAEKEQKKQEKEAAKEAKEKEEAEFKKSGDEFEEQMLKRANKIASTRDQRVEAMMTTLTSILPKSVVVADNGMGVAISDTVTRGEIATAIAAVVDTMEGINNMAGAVQFISGDLINKAVAAKAYRSKQDACAAIKLVVKDKLGKDWNLGTLNYYSNMAERIPLESRKRGVNPSLYLQASKFTVPRLKDAKPSEVEALDKEVEEARNNLIAKINSGEVKDIKQAQAQINEFKAAKGLLKDKPTPITELYKRLFMAQWIKENLLGDKEEIEVQITAKTTKVYTRGELTDIEEDAKNQLQNLLIKQEIPSLVEGFVVKQGKKDKDGNTPEPEKVPYLLDNPFDVETDEEKAE